MCVAVLGPLNLTPYTLHPKRETLMEVFVALDAGEALTELGKVSGSSLPSEEGTP